MTDLLETQNLTKTFQVGGGLGSAPRLVHALSGVSLSLRAGETLAVVGESGCGKSTLARAVAGLVPPTSGEVLLRGESMSQILQRDPMRYRRTVQMVFQDPYSSVNPRRRIGDIIGDGLRLHNVVPRAGRRDAVAGMLTDVGLSAEHIDRYPHELSGGQRQRVAIARALSVKPDLVICDEPVSALDVSVQAQVMNLLLALQQSRNVAYLFISHNLALVQHIAHAIAVMYLGQVIEVGSAAALRQGLAHPYSRMLFDAAPRIGANRGAKRLVVDGDVPSPVNPPPHCRFTTRCPYVEDRCHKETPLLRPVHGRLVRCHRAEEVWQPIAPPPAAKAYSGSGDFRERGPEDTGKLDIGVSAISS